MTTGASAAASPPAPNTSNDLSNVLADETPAILVGKAQRPKRRQKCRFFATRKGCKLGAECPFLHDVTNMPPQAEKKGAKDIEQSTAPAVKDQNTNVFDAESVAVSTSHSQADPSTMPIRSAPAPVRAVARPVPQQQVKDPRTFQISQIKTRFSAAEETQANNTLDLRFKMAPSDPDFPFEIDFLDCTLRLPAGFPQREKPTLRVTNKVMERGYQINVERGFDVIWAELREATLLNAMKVLDRQLETLLTGKKADTIKLVNNAGPKVSTTKPVEPPKEASLVRAPPPPPTTARPAPPRPPPPTSARRAQAESRRQAETQTLEHRLGKHSLFTKGGDGTIFTVPIEPRKRSELPGPLQSIKSIRLFVPVLYDIEPCSIELLGVTEEAASNVEKAFVARAEQNPAAPLLAQVNYLAQNLHILAKQTPEIVEKTAQAVPEIPSEKVAEANPAPSASSRPQDLDKSHIVFIPRPPEWSIGTADMDAAGESTAEESDNDSSYCSDSEDEGATDEEAKPDAPDESSVPREKGISVSFPSLELYGIELLELVSLSVTVRCERCKDTMDVSHVKDNLRGDYAGVRNESCKKCAFAFGIGYRKDIMHANSIRAGYLDLDGCTVVDLLPCNFIPTCSECSTPYPAPGVVSVRGESSIALCRECHRKMTFKIPEVKFLHVGSAGVRADHGLPRKKKKENLGITAGQELPRRGRCSHYSKSHRWFRFSCCAKVFPCDRCHDEATDHPNEFANRMICGYCSREQNYRPEDCGVCHARLTGRTGSGFWEGGKGTREKVKMSRKDPRKYKRRGGGTLRSKAK